VSVDCLARIPEGGELRIPEGAQVTPLAREEAWRRGITLRSGRAESGSGTSLRVAVGSDHGGFAMKSALVEWLRELGHRPMDQGTHDEAACDYPDFALAVARAVADGGLLSWAMQARPLVARPRSSSVSFLFIGVVFWDLGKAVMKKLEGRN
jgi:hypothetical protein